MTGLVRKEMDRNDTGSSETSSGIRDCPDFPFSALDADHWPYIGCCLMLCSYAQLIAVAFKVRERTHQVPANLAAGDAARLEIQEIASQIDFMDASLDNLGLPQHLQNVRHIRLSTV